MLKHLRGKEIEMIFKSIKVFAFLMNIVMCTTCVVAYDELSYKEKIIDDLPVATDFDRFFSALEKAVDFCLRHKHYVDIDMRFGLFLVDVNLRQVLKQKRSSIPAEILQRLENLFVKNDKLVEYFHSMIKNNKNVATMRLHMQMTLLFHNTTTWTTSSDKFNKNLLKQTKIYTPEQLNKMYGKWEDYTRNVLDFETAEPSPKKSDGCLASMARSLYLHSNRISQPNCLIPCNCKRLIDKGSDFGYGLTHRLLFLVVARFSRSCVLFSEKEDQLKADLICKKCFNEAEYIALNNFQLPDLMFEQTSLCSLYGHAQFMRNYWLKTLLEFQNFKGCFSVNLPTGDFDENQMREDENDEWNIVRYKDVMNEQCNAHFTATAVATLSNALRYILECYYYN